jgi:hypothetical protein
MNYNNKNVLPQGQILQAYSPQVQLLQPIRIIATPPMTPYDNDSRSVVDNFSETSYEYYRNNYVFNQMPRQEYSTFGLPPMPPTPPDSPEFAPRGKPRRHSKYSEAVVNGPPPPEPKKEIPEVAVIKLPPLATPVTKVQEEKPKKGGKCTIENLKPGVQYAGDFTPGAALKLTERQFGIIEKKRLRDLEKEEAAAAQVQVPVQAQVQVPVQVPVQVQIPPHLIEKVIFPETTEKPETVANKYIPSSILKKDVEAVPVVEPVTTKYVPKITIQHEPKDTNTNTTAYTAEEPKPVQTHLPYIQGLATEVRPYNTIPETRTEPVEFVTIEQIVYIGSVMYYIPSQCIKMNAAPYIHAQDAEKKVSDNK